MTKNYFDTYSIFIIFIILHSLKSVKYYRNHRGKLRPSQLLKWRKSHTERLESNLKKSPTIPEVYHTFCCVP